MHRFIQNSFSNRRRKDVWVWAVLFAILILYVFSALRLRPVASFGFYWDDGFYFSTAKALADGKGYVLPSFPGHMSSEKTPELYPLLLAGVWKLDPHFPGNILPAVGLTLGFGCLALLLTFLMLRRWPGLGDWWALAVVALVGLSSEFIYLSPMVLSDIPFMALMLGAAWLIECSLAAEQGAGTALGAGVLAGLSVGLRSLGIPVAAGIGLLLLFRRKFRRLFWFCLPGLPLTLFWSWPAIRGVLGLSAQVIAGDPTRSGWTQTVCHYSSYACEWRMSVPNLGALGTTILLNLRFIAQEPGTLLLRPLAVNGTAWSLVVVMVLSAAAYVGVIRHWRRNGWRPLNAILPLYLLVITVFPSVPGRYLLPFAPLFFAGLVLEGRHIGSLVVRRLRQGGGRDERVAAWILGLGALVLAATVTINYAYVIPHGFATVGVYRQENLADERGAYAWLRRHAATDARVIAKEDGLIYLYTGRLAVRPITTLPEAFYLHDPRYAERDAAHLSDVARHIGASYWLTTPYDYLRERKADRALLLRNESALLATARTVYRSPDGRVVLYDTRCLWVRPAQGCDSTTGPGERTRLMPKP